MNTWLGDAEDRIRKVEDGMSALQQMVQGLVDRLEGIESEMEEMEPSVTIQRLDTEPPKPPKWRQMIDDEKEQLGENLLSLVLYEMAHLQDRIHAGVEENTDCLARIAAACEKRVQADDPDRVLDPEASPISGYVIGVENLLWMFSGARWKPFTANADDWWAMGNGAANWLGALLRQQAAAERGHEHEWINYGHPGGVTYCRFCGEKGSLQ